MCHCTPSIRTPNCGKVGCFPKDYARQYAIQEAVTSKPVNAQIENNFMYHAPKVGQPAQYEALRAKAKELAYLIDELCPKSREQSLAMTNLEQALFWANAGIARN